MDSKVITISIPSAMLRIVDEAAAASYQTRSNFIRMAVVEKFGAQSQYELCLGRIPEMHTDKQIGKMYDFPEQYDQFLAEMEADKTED